MHEGADKDTRQGHRDATKQRRTGTMTEQYDGKNSDERAARDAALDAVLDTVRDASRNAALSTTHDGAREACGDTPDLYAGRYAGFSASETDGESLDRPTGRLTTFPGAETNPKTVKRRAPKIVKRRASKTTAEKAVQPELPETRKPNFFKHTIKGWFNRLLHVVTRGSLGAQGEPYAAHRTTRDYIWNTLGITSLGVVFPLLTVVVTQLIDVVQAGMFAMAFVVGILLMFLGNYGVRTYQVSDLDETHSFSDYQINRWLTCIVMVLAGILYCLARGYASDMLAISMGVYLYKMIDALADVYEGRLQQMDKLYLAGISQTIRSIFVLVTFILALLITRNLVVACIAMAIVAALSFIIVTLPLAYLETPRSRKFNLASIRKLFVQCFPLFVAFFMYELIGNMPKFAMEGAFAYDNQLYFNAMYFPAMIILITIGLIYKPQLVRMAKLWADPLKHRIFDLILIAVFAAVVILVVAMCFIMDWIGISVMNFLYGEDFDQFREMIFIMLAAGGMAAAVDFLYQVITVLRKQKAVMLLYVIGFGFALLVCILLVNYAGLAGAVISYLIVMSILFVLLALEFFRIRFSFAHELKTLQQEELKLQRSNELTLEDEQALRFRLDGSVGSPPAPVADYLHAKQLQDDESDFEQ